MDWSGVDYLWIIVMFLSAVWTLILTAPIHCRGSIAEQVMQCYISTNLMKKQTNLHLGWPEDEYILGDYSFKYKQVKKQVKKSAHVIRQNSLIFKI